MQSMSQANPKFLKLISVWTYIIYIVQVQIPSKLALVVFYVATLWAWSRKLNKSSELDKHFTKPQVSYSPLFSYR